MWTLMEICGWMGTDYLRTTILEEDIRVARADMAHEQHYLGCDIGRQCGL